LEICGVAVRLHLSAALVDMVEDVFGHFRSEPLRPHVELRARVTAEGVRISGVGRRGWSCKRAEFVPLIKAQLVEEVLRAASYEVALHAAAYVRGSRALLLVGSPGAGKTTLGLALAAEGFELAADDVVLMGEDGLVTGLPFPLAAKAGSWGLAARRWPRILNCATYRRPDGRRVRYFLPDRLASPGPRRIGCVALLDRRRDAATTVKDIDPAIALAALITEGTAPDRRLSSRGFASLVAALDGARCCRLTYSDLDEAASRMCGLCS
jgi:hypothetical protein